MTCFSPISAQEHPFEGAYAVIPNQTLLRQFVETTRATIHVRSNWREERPDIPILCLPMSGDTGESFAAIMANPQSAPRWMAVDYPGTGNSSAFHDGVKDFDGKASIADYAQALWEVVDQLGFDRIHIFGHHTGCKIAVEMAAIRPYSVDRILLAATSMQPSMPRSRKRTPRPLAGDALWQKINNFLPASCSDVVRHRIFTEALRRADGAADAQQAAADYCEDYPVRLKALQSDTLLLNLGDDLVKKTPQVLPFLETANLVERLDWSHGFLDDQAEDVLSLAQSFFYDQKAESEPNDPPSGFLFQTLGARENLQSDIRISDRNIVWIETGFAFAMRPKLGGGEEIFRYLRPGSLIELQTNEWIHFLTDGSVTIVDGLAHKSQIKSSASYALRVEKAHQETLASLKAISALRVSPSADHAVAGYLMMLSDYHDCRLPGEIPILMKRSEIGNCLGLTFETVSRRLSRMRDLGVLTVSKSGVIIKKLDSVLALAGVRQSTSLPTKKSV
ncbi:alpha/beta fold hydrolase [Algimonas porphyrae]|nr:alpha/beta fold hydrolase [Algimonas porphyrae]